MSGGGGGLTVGTLESHRRAAPVELPNLITIALIITIIIITYLMVGVKAVENAIENAISDLTPSETVDAGAQGRLIIFTHTTTWTPLRFLIQRRFGTPVFRARRRRKTSQSSQISHP